MKRVFGGLNWVKVEGRWTYPAVGLLSLRSSYDVDTENA